MINRAAILLVYKQPAVDWINNKPVSYDRDLVISLEDTNTDRTIYLIRDKDADTPDTLDILTDLKRR